MSNLTPDIFEQLFRTHYHELYGFAFSFLNDAEASKDIVSEVFAEMWKNHDTLEVKQPMKYYLYISVRNRCYSHLRRSHPTLELTSLIEASLREEGMDQLLNLEEHINAIEQVLATMSPKTRQVMRLCYYGNLKYREAAEELGISSSAVKKHIMKGLALLRQHFNVNKH